MHSLVATEPSMRGQLKNLLCAHYEIDGRSSATNFMKNMFSVAKSFCKTKPSYLFARQLHEWIATLLVATNTITVTMALLAKTTYHYCWLQRLAYELLMLAVRGKVLSSVLPYKPLKISSSSISYKRLVYNPAY